MKLSLSAQALRRDALIVVLAAFSVAAYALLSGADGFPLDDSWIHQTYGRNLAQTGQWAFVPGIPSAGSTSPLYTVLLALGYRLGIHYMAWAFTLGGFALALGGLVGARLARRLFPDVPQVGLWAGVALVTAWHLVWAAASGMETMLFSALVVVVSDIALWQIDPAAPGRTTMRGRFGGGMAFGLAGALLIATRPEGVLLVAILVMAVIIARPQPDWQTFGAWLLGAAIGGGVGIAPYALLNLSLNGTLLPNTFSAKQEQNAPLLVQPFLVNLWAMIQPLTAGGQLALVPGALTASVYLFRRPSPLRLKALYFAPLVWSGALLLLYVLRLPAPYQHGRYVMPTLPPFIIFGVGGTLLIAHHRWRAVVGRVLARSLLLITLLLFAIFWWIGALAFVREVGYINSDMVAAARWLEANVPPERLLAVHDIGAVGFFASSVDKPRPILDIAGLVSPEVIPLFRNPAGMLDLMRRRSVQYLMVLPPQWDELWLGEPETWATQFCPRFNAGGGMGGMAIYEYVENGRCLP